MQKNCDGLILLLLHLYYTCRSSKEEDEVIEDDDDGIADTCQSRTSRGNEGRGC